MKTYQEMSAGLLEGVTFHLLNLMLLFSGFLNTTVSLVITMLYTLLLFIYRNIYICIYGKEKVEEKKAEKKKYPSYVIIVLCFYSRFDSQENFSINTLTMCTYKVKIFEHKQNFLNNFILEWHYQNTFLCF